MHRDRLFGWLSAAMAILFVTGGAVQINDPDPWIWIAVYGTAAGVTLLVRAWTNLWWIAGTVAAVCLVWAGTLAPGVIGAVSPGELLEEMEAGGGPIEEGRELGGLLLIALWASIACFRAWGIARRRFAGRSSPQREMR